jgi:hypothetical protein
MISESAPMQVSGRVFVFLSSATGTAAAGFQLGRGTCGRAANRRPDLRIGSSRPFLIVPARTLLHPLCHGPITAQACPLRTRSPPS